MAQETLYRYYRAGVEAGRLIVTGKQASFRRRNLETLAWEALEPCKPGDNPLDPELDRRLPDAIAFLASGAAPDANTYEPYLDVESAGVKGKIWAQRAGDFPLDIITVDGKAVGTIDNERAMVGVLVRDGLEGLSPQAGFARPELSKADYGVRLHGTYMVAMRDGVRLSTDVYLPVGLEGKRLPTVLVRTCYAKDTSRLFRAFAHYGYAYVVQDTRGREQSEGEWRPLVHEMEDGDDTLNWIAAQPWSDGGVGMIGSSYLGTVQWTAASTGNPHLKALVSICTGGLPVIDFPHRNGVLCSGTLTWAFYMADRVKNPAAMERPDWDEVMKIRPIKDIPQKALGKPIPFWDEWMAHEYYDSYWEPANWMIYQHNINVPALYISGWYDDVGTCTSVTWDMNVRGRREHQRMIVGPWRHQNNIGREIHGIRFGPDSLRYDLFEQYLGWYDRFLKGVDNGADREPAVEYYMAGENRWRSGAAWPPRESEPTPFYLSSGGNANTSSGDGRVELETDGCGCDRYIFDPADPAPFLIDMNENEVLVPENYRDVELRSDVLVYTSPVLEEDLWVAGEPKAVLYAASAARDTDWVVRLTEVDGAGNSIRMSDGLIRARFRKSYVEPTPLMPGEIVRYDIPMTWIANRFSKGNRIRVEVTSGAENVIFPNPGTGLPTATDTGAVTAEQTVYHGLRRPSCVYLPVLRKGAGK